MSLFLLIECEVTLLFAVAQLLYDKLTELVLKFGKSSLRSFIVLFCFVVSINCLNLPPRLWRSLSTNPVAPAPQPLELQLGHFDVALNSGYF